MPPSRSENRPVDLVHVYRGALLESIHRGSLVVLQGNRTLLRAGVPERVVYFRSTAKPLQALVCITSGAADTFGLDDRELAIVGGSHNASPVHLETVRSVLAKAGVEESALRCGGHWSIDSELARAQWLEQREARPLPAIWSNCSGKHAGMLAAARAMSAPTEGYLEVDHPVQRAITGVIAAFTDVDAASIAIGLDGCGAPVHGVDLYQMARAMVRLGRPALLADEKLRVAATRMGRAYSAHPEMVAGAGRFDTDLMQTARVRILSKGGAEGVHGIAVPERGLGIAVKVDDGKDRGYRLPLIELLRRYGVLSQEEAEQVAERHGRTIYNFAGAEVGRLEVAPGLAREMAGDTAGERAGETAGEAS